MADADRRPAITVYGQNEVVSDLIEARLATGRPLLLRGATTSACTSSIQRRPRIRFTARRRDARDPLRLRRRLRRLSRHLPSVDPRRRAAASTSATYPFGWLGILADAAPSSDELVYSLHDRGFALFSMRSPTVTRLYLQVPPDETIDELVGRRDLGGAARAAGDRRRLDADAGRITQKGVTPMRSFVAEPMRYGRLFLAGDAAHIVPPTGAKGLNLAMADVCVLAARSTEFYAPRPRATGSTAIRRACLRRAWRAQRFSWWMTSMLHRNEAATAVRPAAAARRTRVSRQLHAPR